MRYFRFSILLLASLVLFNPAVLIAQRRVPLPQHESQSLLKKPRLPSGRVIHRENNEIMACQRSNPKNRPKPRIGITQITQSSALRGGKYIVEGIIDGVCLKEAGLYQNGERVIVFNLTTTRIYKRYPFKIEVHVDDKPEIRAFDINWRRTSKMLIPKDM